jgi:hypothetical protein
MGIGSFALLSNPRKLSFWIVAAGCALAIAACGGSVSGRSGAHSGGLAPTVTYADCVRSHGVPNFPDAKAGGGFDVPSTINTQSPAYLAARQACTKPPAAPMASRGPSDRQQLELIGAAKCMRAHGVNVSDPTFNGAYMTLDELDQTTIASPAFKRAEPVCHYPVPNNAGSLASP